MNARYYDPENGRFISQDTYRGELDELDQWHLYAYCANNPINYTDPSGNYRLHTWILADLIDLGLDVIGVGLAFNPIKYVLRKATHSAAARKKATKEIYKTFLILRRSFSCLCRALSKLVKRLFGIKVNLSKLYRYLRGSFYGKVNGWVADQLISNISVFFSIGSFVAAACDIQYNGYLRGRIWKLW